MSEEEEFIRHNIFREELYTFAHLPKKEFQTIFDEFKNRRSDLLIDKKPVYLDISGYQLRKYIKERRL